MKPISYLLPALALTLSGLALPAQASEALLEATCGSCHAATPAGLSRIAGQRKTPEGWLMTIVRMRIAHGMEISNADQAALVSYLAETRGLAPSETAGLRYVLERDPAAQEAFEQPVAGMCGRCHTAALVALQHRTAEEWAINADFHVGQFPTVEYQAGGRDREWFRIAKDEIAPLLAQTYPYETAAWTAWQAAAKPAVVGDWIVLTEIPGKGEAYGRLTVSGSDSPYDVSGTLRAAGEEMAVSGRMNLYTGYEWRANLKVGEQQMRQVLAVSEDGARLDGRQFLRDRDSLGGHLAGVRADGGPAILGAVPSVLGTGTSQVQFVGTGLGGLSLAGLTAEGPAENSYGASAQVTASGNAAVALSAGGTSATLATYATVDRIAVEPAFTVARVGGGSDVGPGVVPAYFKAIGFWNGADGQPGTGDDVRIGAIPATWSVGNFTDAAEAMQDAKFAGAMDAATGIFMPAVAGPNPERPYSTNNAGDLKVTAEAAGQTADAQLIVTVQRFIDPPIR